MYTRSQEPSEIAGEEGEDLEEEAFRWQDAWELLQRILETEKISPYREGLVRLRALIEERREIVEELTRVVTRKFQFKRRPPGIVSKR